MLLRPFKIGKKISYVVVQLETVLVMEGSSFVQLLDEDRIPELTRIFRILCRIHIKGPRFIKELMSDHVKQVGKV
jgi:hypothetical protein